MKSEDLMKNMLDDDLSGTTKKIAGKVMSTYERAQRLSLYFVILKMVIAMLVVGGVMYGGYYFVSNMKQMATEAVVDEAKEVASEKYNAAKEKVAEKTEGKSLFGALSSVADDLNSKFDSIVDDRLIEQGYDPEAPNYCAGNPSQLQIKTCIQYTDAELSMEDYEWVQTAWKGTCEEVHESSISLLTLAGKLTYNDKRALIKQCDDIKAGITDDELEEMKRQMITGEPNVQRK